jgi:hypothetical protein
MKDIFWTDLLKFFFELKTKEKIPLNVDTSLITDMSSLFQDRCVVKFDISKWDVSKNL